MVELLNMDAKTMQEISVKVGIENHQSRIKWLESENPRWSDGVLLSPFDRVDLLRQSRAFLKDYLVPND